MKSFGIGAVLLLLSSVVYSNTLPAVVAHVTGAGTYNDGSIYVFFDRPISSCSDAARIDLVSSHSAREQVLSLAMTALVSGRAVVVHPGGCSGTAPVFGPEGDSFIYLTILSPI